MALAVETPITTSAGDGVTAAFATVWTFEQATDVVVTVAPPAGLPVLQVRGVDYDVVAATPTTTGGNVVFRGGHIPANGSSVVRSRATPFDQADTQGDQSKFLPSAIVRGLDRVVRRLQELARDVAIAFATANQALAHTGAFISPLDFDAKGDGVTDDTAAVVLALAEAAATGRPIHGGCRTYAVSNDIAGSSHLTVDQLNLLQIAPGPTRKTLYFNNATDVALNRLKIDRGDDPASGDRTNAAGLWFANCSRIALDTVEVTGHGSGLGSWFDTCADVTIDRYWAHDTDWSAVADPGIDQYVGARWHNCNNLRFRGGRIQRLGGLIGANPRRYYQTDGIDCGGDGWSIEDTLIEKVGEGIDGYDSGGNSNFLIRGVTFVDVDSWALKLGNLCRDGIADAWVAIRPGLGGCVVGVFQADVVKNLLISNFKVRDAGASLNWFGQNIVGLAILDGSLGMGGYADGIEFVNGDVQCATLDGAGHLTMLYGARCEPDPRPFGAQKRKNRLRNFTSIGHYVAKTLGYIGDPVASVTSNAPQAIPNNVGAGTTVTFNNTVADAYLAIVGNTYTAQEDETVHIEASVEFAAAAGGQRILTVFQGGVATGLRTVETGSATAPATTPISGDLVLAKGNTLTLSAFQDSGGALNITGGLTRFSVRRIDGAT